MNNWQKSFREQKWKTFNNKNKWYKYYNIDMHNTQNCHIKCMKNEKSDKADKSKKN